MQVYSLVFRVNQIVVWFMG